MKPISRETSQKISLWSFVSAVAVVVIHCSWEPESKLGLIGVFVFRDTLARMAVPFFFVCSGYFLACHFDDAGWWRREVGKRIVSLGMPYLIWTLALAGVLFVERNEVMGFGGFGLNPCRMPALAPLWYVRSLLLFVVLSPIFKFVAEHGKLWAVFVSYGLLVSLAPLSRWCGWTDEHGFGGLLHYCLSVEGAFYFLVGICLQRGLFRLPSRREAFVLVSIGCGMMVLRLVFLLASVDVPVDLRCVITPTVLAGLWRLTGSVALPSPLVGCAFPIFVMHGLVIASMRVAGGVYHVCNPWLELLSGVIIPIVFVLVVRRLAPCVARVLFGGRC